MGLGYAELVVVCLSEYVSDFLSNVRYRRGKL